jgi:hypothetical protein
MILGLVGSPPQFGRANWINLDLEEELEEFQGTFERDKLWRYQF